MVQHLKHSSVTQTTKSSAMEIGRLIENHSAVTMVNYQLKLSSLEFMHSVQSKSKEFAPGPIKTSSVNQIKKN